MFNIEDFLVRFKNIKPPNDTTRGYISDIIFDILNIKIEKTDIKINNNSVYIKTSHIIKNEIFLNKQNILNKLNKKLDKNKLNNIF